MIPKSTPFDLIRGWLPAFGQDHASRNRRSTQCDLARSFHQM